MRTFLALIVSLGLASCGSGTAGDDALPVPDAPPAGAFGAACVTVSDTSTECTSMVCTNSFDMIGHPVCSVKCTMADPSVCPVGSMGQKCNMQGYCRP